MVHRRAISGVVWLTLILVWQAAAQPMTVAAAARKAIENYPAVRVSEEQVNAASAAIRLARTTYLPKVDALGQMNRATRNNTFGLLLPQSVLPAMSGPVLGTNGTASVWGSAVGVLVSWEPFDFGLRQASVDAAASARERAARTLERTRFEVEAGAADAFLTLVAAGQAAAAAQAGVDRTAVLLDTTGALVKAELRPGADASRAEAELAAARNLAIQATQAVEVARATLAQYLGMEPAQVQAAAGNLLEEPPAEPSPASAVSTNPAAREQSAAVDEAEARLKVAGRSYFPRFNLQGAEYARGTGAATDGRTLGGVNGLGPNIQDFAVGLTVTFHALDLPSVRANEAIQTATVHAEQARYRQVLIDLTGRLNRARAALDGARQVAANVPSEVRAARAALAQATARYQSGLGNIVEVAEAQRLLTQAEIDNALARLGIWRARLSVAAAQGDIGPFLAEASK